jgi:hypothetical protein
MSTAFLVPIAWTRGQAGAALTMASTGWLILERSGALGSLVGSLGIGLLSQRIGLSGALPLELVAFGLAALLLRGRPVRWSPAK